MRACTLALVVACASALRPAPLRVERRVLAKNIAGAALAFGLAAPTAALADVKVSAGAVKDAGGAKSAPGARPEKNTRRGATRAGRRRYAVVKEGSCPITDPLGLAGSCLPQQGSFAIIDYTGFLPDGRVFDTTEKKGGKPLAFKLGEKQVIAGIEEVVARMRPGEEVQALIPAGMAYGDKGVCTDDGECLIKPGMNLKYFIRLNRIAASAG